MNRRLFAVAFLFTSAAALAQTARKAPAKVAAAPVVAPAVKSATSVASTVISPVFHQLVAYSVPAMFDLKPSEEVKGKSFLRETVLRGQTVDRWTEMITLTGAEGAVTGGLTPQHMIDAMGGGYQRACPKTFAFKAIGEVTISGLPAYLALASCGSVAEANGEAGAAHSETAILLAVAGEQDMYTLQWAERSEAAAEPLPFDEAKWQKRFQAMQPIRVCNLVPGEKAPYRSCLK